MAQNKQTLRPQIEYHYGSYLITYPNGYTRLVQTDWEYPVIARDLGWNGKIGRERCNHRNSDGTVACPECGKSATEFIQAAAKYLDSLI